MSMETSLYVKDMICILIIYFIYGYSLWYDIFIRLKPEKFNLSEEALGKTDYWQVINICRDI